MQWLRIGIQFVGISALALAAPSCASAYSSDRDDRDERLEAVSSPAVMGADERNDLYGPVAQHQLDAARAVGTMLSEQNFESCGDGFGCSPDPYLLKPLQPISQTFGPICSGVRFRDQARLGDNSVFLVAPQLIATAAHAAQGSPSSRRVIFDWEQVNSTIAPPTSFPASSVYTPIYVVGTKYENGVDWSLLRLDRPVTDRPFLPVRLYGTITDNEKVYQIGHPFGLPKKITTNVADVAFNLYNPAAFRTSIDSQSGNSGGPVINWATGLVEGINVRFTGGGPDATGMTFTPAGCKVWSTCDYPSCYSEADRITNMGHLLRTNGSILWHNPSSGQPATWNMNRENILRGIFLPSVPNNGWKIAGTGEFDQGSNARDVFWHNPYTGETSIWYMNSAQTQRLSSSVGTVPRGIDWKVEALGDFDADGETDVTWRNSITRRVEIWWSGRTDRAPLGYPALGNLGDDWAFAGAGDVNGDGTADWVIRGVPGWPTENLVMVTLMGSGGPIQYRQFSGVPKEWQIIGIGRVNGDNKQDLLFRHTGTGQTSVWFMNGLADPSSALGGTADNSWAAKGVADFNGDQIVDVFWEQPSTGKTALWTLNSAGNVATGVDVGAKPTGSQFAGILRN